MFPEENQCSRWQLLHIRYQIFLSTCFCSPPLWPCHNVVLLGYHLIKWFSPFMVLIFVQHPIWIFSHHCLLLLKFSYSDPSFFLGLCCFVTYFIMKRASSTNVFPLILIFCGRLFMSLIFFMSSPKNAELILRLTSAHKIFEKWPDIFYEFPKKCW